MSLTHFPRVQLAALPTPLETAPRLSAALGTTVFVKRDDLTGLALGGNKARKLEFLLGAAREAGATVVLTTAGMNSNYLRMAAAGARKAGMLPILFLRGSAPEALQGNMLINEITGAEMRFIDVSDPWSPAARALMETAAREVEAQGERAYVITLQTTHAPLAALGYVDAALELHRQLLDRGEDARYLVLPTGSGVTQAGLIVGARMLGWPLQVIGIAGSPGVAETHGRRVAEIAKRVIRLLGLRLDLSPDDVIVDDRYAGAGYGQPLPGTIRAIRESGELEGLLLDPVYTGKAMHGLFDWVRQDRIAAGEKVIFLHTGGAPNLFAQADTLGPALRADKHEESGRLVAH